MCGVVKCASWCTVPERPTSDVGIGRWRKPNGCSLMGLAEGSLDGTAVYRKFTRSSFEVSMLDLRVALVKISNLLAMFMVQQVYVEVFFCIFESVLLIFLKHPMTSFEERVSVGLLSGDITPTNRPRVYEIHPNGDDTSSS